MTSNSEIKKIVSDAKRVAAKAEASGESDVELLAAIRSVAAQIKEKAGNDPAIGELLNQIDSLTQPGSEVQQSST